MIARSFFARVFGGPGPREPEPPVDPHPPLVDVEGSCPVCGQATRFRAWTCAFRDGLICIRCNSLPRERALFAVLETVCPEWRTKRIHESSPTTLDGKFARECPGYSASYFDAEAPLGIVTGAGWRNEDLENLSFPDATFDLFVTQDVFEHLLDPARAIREIARTLKPRGMHIATVPLARKAKPSRRRAVRRDDGRVRLLRQPEHHADPIAEGGSLVTVDWGYDIAEFFDRGTGLSTTIVHLDDMSRGIRADLIEVLVSRKTAPSRI